MREKAENIFDITSQRNKEDEDSWCWNEVQDGRNKKEGAKKKWDRQGDMKSHQEYKDMCSRTKKADTKAKRKCV